MRRDEYEKHNTNFQKQIGEYVGLKIALILRFELNRKLSKSEEKN